VQLTVHHPEREDLVLRGLQTGVGGDQVMDDLVRYTAFVIEMALMMTLCVAFLIGMTMLIRWFLGDEGVRW